MKFLNHNLSKIKFIDFHTHLQESEPSQNSGVLKVFSVELEDFMSLNSQVKQRKLFSVGLHPWRLAENLNCLQMNIEEFRKIAEQPNAIALGEAGLDRVRGPGIDIQTAYFRELIRLAAETRKPLIVHCVRCYPELTALKKQFGRDVKMMVHGYNANPRILDQLFEHGFYVSFGIAAFKREDICLYIKNNPQTLSRLCLETDDSDINIQDVYALAARESGLDIEDLSRIMKNNFISLFQEPENA
jgi:TatD DNase family protein